MKTTAGIIFLLLAVSSYGYHKDTEHLLLEGKSRYEGFLSGLLDDPDFKVSQQCFSSELISKVEEVFDSAVNIFFQRDLTQALKFFYSAQSMIEYFDKSCNMSLLFKQFYQLCSYGACNPRNLVTNLKNQVRDVMMHLGNQAYATYQIEKTWDEDEYFRLIRDKYRHIGGLVGLAFGERHDHTLQEQEKQEKNMPMSILSNVTKLVSTDYVDPSDIKEDYTILKHFIQGIIQGLSEKGNEKKKCYKNLSYMRDDFNTAVDILVKTLEGENNIAIISLAATQTYGHLKGIYRDCRLSDFGGKLFRLNEIYDNLTQNQQELNAILVNFGMAALTRDFIRAGQLIGNLVKISLDFHVY